MSNTVVDFEGLYLVSMYNNITKVVNELFNCLIYNEKASLEFLENNENSIICNSYVMMKTINKSSYTYDEIRAIVTQNASVILAHSLLHDDNCDNDNISSNQLCKTITYFTGIIHKYYY